ncbi:MAG: hypothetical protein Q3997_02190 [Propionibacteriaceae bacterium]|nr:hypothetical protein [Propionibacteriaceae bacterium]
MRFTRESLLVGGLVIAALFLGSYIVQLFPPPQDITRRPFPHAATVGAPVELRTGTLTVTSITKTQQMVTYGEPVRTTGAFIVVTYLFRPHREPTPPSTLIARDDKGRRFQGSPSTIGCPYTLPGITSVCSLVVEVAGDATGLTLEIPAHIHPDGDDVAVYGVDKMTTAEKVEVEAPRVAREDELR